MIESIASPEAKTLSIGRSEIALTSTWLPFQPSTRAPRPCERVVSKYTKKPRHTSPDPTNYNEPIVIVEMSIGEVRGQTTFEDLDAAVRIFNARPRTPTRPAPSTPKSQASFIPTQEKDSNRPFPDLPRFVGSCTFAALEVRLVAPSISSSVDQPHPGPSTASFRRSPSFRSKPYSS